MFPSKILFCSVYFKIVAKGMVERGSIGAIVMVSSNCGIRAIPGFSVYCCTKGAMDQLCRCLAIELGPHKVIIPAGTGHVYTTSHHDV